MARALTPEQAAELSTLYARCSMVLDAFVRAEPEAQTLVLIRETVQRIHAVGSLPRMRAMVRELRGMQSALPLGAQRALSREMVARFGPDADAAKDAATAAAALVRGRIRSEREYRTVCAHADAIAGDPGAQEAYRALGALLDAYMAVR